MSGTPDFRKSQSSFSKVGGAPCWLQDPVPVDGSIVILQLASEVFEMLGPAPYSNVSSAMGSGIGYLFLRQKPKPGRAGYFFVQDT